MYIKKIKLKNYRNYKDIDIDIENGVNVFYGDNAVGKTNLLESIYLSSTSKSHKNSKENEIINFDEEKAHIYILYVSKDKEHTIDIQLNRDIKKGIAFDKVKIDKVSDFIGLFSVIMFSPEDLNIIKEGPKERRKFIDILLCQTDKIYINVISRYNKILNERNVLLKDIKYADNINKKELINLLDSYDEQLVYYGSEIIKKRKLIIDELREKVIPIHKKISDEKDFIYIKYDTVDINYREYLEERRDEDIKNQFTSIGPHRDDISFYIKEDDIRKFGSQGQKKTLAISLKLTELEIIREKIGESPILLLDDVFSELDEGRQIKLVNNLSGIQTLITCTGIKKNIYDLLKPDAKFKVADNNLIKIFTSNK